MSIKKYKKKNTEIEKNAKLKMGNGNKKSKKQI